MQQNSPFAISLLVLLVQHLMVLFVILFLGNSFGSLNLEFSFKMEQTQYPYIPGSWPSLSALSCSYDFNP